MATDWEKIISQFSGKKILVVGDVVIDEYVHGDIHRSNPESPAPLLKAEREDSMTGGAGNVAKNAAQLGAKTTLIAVVGADERAEKLREQAEKEQYVPVLIADRSRPTIRKIRFYKGMEQLLRVDYEETHDISSDIEDAVIDAIDDVISEGVDGIIVSDYAKGTITARVAKYILEIANEKKIVLAADVKPSRANFFVGASIVSPNLKEAKQFLGLPEDTEQTIKQIATSVHEKMKAVTYVTLSADGVYYYASPDDHNHVPQEHVVDVFDVSGAGDTAITVLLLAQLSGASHAEAAKLSNAAGAVVVSKVGSVGLSQSELTDMILNRKAQDDER